MIAIVGSSVLFSIYHYHPGFTLSAFFLYTFAGLYFAAIYHVRGFGIVVGCHALYDVLVAVLDLTKMTQQG